MSNVIFNLVIYFIGVIMGVFCYVHPAPFALSNGHLDVQFSVSSDKKIIQYDGGIYRLDELHPVKAELSTHD